MSSTWGTNIKLSIFGGSHTEAIGVVLDNLPANEKIDLDAVRMQMARRAPGKDKTATTRAEADEPQILSGLLNGITTGAPLAAIIQNTNTRPKDYSLLKTHPRPGHADYTASIRYDGANDIRGGGHFSGRLTACLVFAGAVCRQILERRGVTVGAHALQIGAAKDSAFDPVHVSADVLNALNTRFFAVNEAVAEQAMRDEIENARLDADSIGGVIECAAVGMPAGIGSPMFGGVENILASILYGIPAVKGVEFGAGFGVSALRGSENNDAFYYGEDGHVYTETNHAGGILGGITTGMPIVFRVAVKPTPSIGKIQNTVDLLEKKNDTLTVVGRHDPCIVPRAIPVVEAAAAIALLDMML
ncbi:MAG: chorismate synthase [Clostridia bacterium]|nr:chorismate synthase [Clostridia bacterium]